ncbi:hypothetical protein GCM10007382_23700 [Salinibacterium xinjiangense]|uniref:Uncharacterized protein n=1 Tax=Salinibacterium xinjiangense TaxID=386302 RepID=A0A2C9A0C7_9MICO|nr:hypothetical protein GCM10007382_23700 [Salinibacterium xinjiangense]SOE72278.1 hypothetical protein SAMN06296378_2439 [Salinibacterium xinjiangense]
MSPQSSADPLDANIFGLISETALSIVITGGTAATTRLSETTISGTADAVADSKVTVTVAGQVLTSWEPSEGSWRVRTAALADGVQSRVTAVTAGTGIEVMAEQVLTVGASDPLIAIYGGSWATTTTATTRIAGTTVGA